MQTDQPSRERGSELYEVRCQFQEQGKRLNECYARLCAIGNKLEDQGGEEKAEDPNKKIEPRIPGLTADLFRDADGFRELINGISKQICKLEKHI